ncbi:MAG: flagellar filament capping protein FliD, partial [Gammaproteobacteria bacterium]|nr:flagellar filament capping protein FliD [Gammaproteobacteria bacterium]
PDIPAKNITITQENSSLRGIQDAINKSDAGIRASVINDGNGYRLVLTSRIAGTENSIRIKVNDDDRQNEDVSGLSALSYTPEGTQERVDAEGRTVLDTTGINLEEIIEPQDALINIDGIEITNSGNEISSAIDGLILNLKPGSEGSSVRLNVEINKNGIADGVKNFVDKYNAMINTAETLTGYDAETKTAGPLSGDSSIRGIISQTRRTMGDNFSQVNTTYDSLSSIGIDTQYDGTLKLDTVKFQDAVENNFQQVVQLFAVSGSATDPAVRYLEAGESTPTGAYELNVTHMASQGAYQSKNLPRLPIVISDQENIFKLNVDGVNSGEIILQPDNYTDMNLLAAELQNKVNADDNFQKNNISIEAYISNGKLFLVSNRFGSASYVEVTQADQGLRRELGLKVEKGVHGEDIAGTFNGEPGTGTGHVLTGKRIADGLQVEVREGDTGERGLVFFSHGIGARLHDLSSGFLSSEGLIGLRTDGYSNRIEDINKDREKLAHKLEVSEQRYLKQFTNLDATLGKMRSTGDYLSNQLASLPGAAKPRR